MLKSVTVINFKGDKLLLDLFNPWSSGIIIQNIDGIGPGQADINTTDMATGDGAWYNSSRLQTRNITMTLKPIRDPMVETNRHKIYRYFPVKTKVSLQFITDERDLTVEGYVENCEPTIFSQSETLAISILCPDPYFYANSVSEEAFSGIRSGFEFPFSSESIQLVGEKVDYNDNLVPNYNFMDPLNDAMEGNENLIKDYNLTLHQTTIPTVAAESDISDDTWACVNTGDGTGTAWITPEGVVVSRDISDPPGWTRLVYAYPVPEDFVKEDCTLSFSTGDFGLITTTAKMVLESTGELGNKTFGSNDQKYISLYYDSAVNKIFCRISVAIGQTVTVKYAKFEHGSTQTLVSKTPKKHWHGKGPTINEWSIYGGQYGNFSVDVQDGIGIKLQNFMSDEEDFIYGTDLFLQRGQKVTISSLIDKTVHSKTYELPEDGAYEFTDLTLPSNFILSLKCAEGTNQARLAYTHLSGSGDDNIVVAATKAEYGEAQTLAKDGELITKPVDEDYVYTGGTIEFGVVRLDTKASLFYDGDAEAGVTITLHATGGVEMITLMNLTSGGHIVIDTDKILKITGVTFDAPDDILVNTKLGQRSVRLLHNGRYYNIIGAVQRDAEWFTLTVGENTFAFQCRSGEENLSVTFTYTNNYGGI